VGIHASLNISIEVVLYGCYSPYKCHWHYSQVVHDALIILFAYNPNGIHNGLEQESETRQCLTDIVFTFTVCPFACFDFFSKNMNPIQSISKTTMLTVILSSSTKPLGL